MSSRRTRKSAVAGTVSPRTEGVHDVGATATSRVSIRDFAREHLVLLGIVAISLFIGASSALRYPFPVSAGGLFLDAAQRISDNGYALPARVPGYTDGGIPFAYPPLMLYALAAVHDATGISLLTLERFLPPLLTAVYLLPFYLLAREVLTEKRSALFATFITAVSPSAFFYHLDAGGVVRAPAFAFLLFGLYLGHRMFRSEDRTYVAYAAIFFALTLLSHVGYATLFGASLIVFCVFLQPSREGFIKGVLVAVGGLLLSAPWWIWVIHEHGAGVFANALFTHRSIAGTVYRTVTLTIHREPFLPIWHVLAIVGLLYLVSRGRYLLPVWLVALMVAYPPEESIMLVGSLLAAVAVFEVVVPKAETASRAPHIATISATAIIVGALALYGFGSGMAAVQRVPSGDVAYWGPSFDDDDRDAMHWSRANTPDDAHFMVVGNQAEWFPVFAERTSVVGHWGAEWKRGEFARQTSIFKDMIDCGHKLADCIEQVRADNDLRAEYVYTPKTDDTISLRHSLGESPNWQVAYENEGVAIFHQR